MRYSITRACNRIAHKARRATMFLADVLLALFIGLFLVGGYLIWRNTKDRGDK